MNKAAYVASKHGVVGLTKVAAPGDGRDRGDGQRDRARLGPHPAGRGPDPGPGPAGGTRASNRRVRELLAEKQPSEQFVTPAQIGELVVFLCGPAADQIRGQTIGIDGGWTAQ